MKASKFSEARSPPVRQGEPAARSPLNPLRHFMIYCSSNFISQNSAALLAARRYRKTAR